MNVVTVIRTNGERTAAVCERLVREQADEVHVIAIKPFTAAVIRCFEIGLESGADWLMTVDADVLVRPGAVRELWAYMHRMRPAVCHYQGTILDKLSMSERVAGPRMWRVSALEQLLPLVEDAIRVESNVLQRAKKLGWRSELLSEFNAGVHDYEQYYRDLYRKAKVHSIKFASWGQAIVPKWRRGDLDLQAAYAGWYGLPWTEEEKDPLPNDWRPDWTALK